jgi:hypothetical protein
LSTKSNDQGNTLGGAPIPATYPKPGKLIKPSSIGPPTSSPALFVPPNEESNALPNMVTNPLEAGLLTGSSPSPIAGPAVAIPPGTSPPDLDNGIARGVVAQTRIQNPAQRADVYTAPSSARGYGTAYSYGYPVTPNLNGQGIVTYNSQTSSQDVVGTSAQSSKPAGQVQGISATGSASLLGAGNRYQYNTANGRSLPLATSYTAYGQQGSNQRSYSDSCSTRN